MKVHGYVILSVLAVNGFAQEYPSYRADRQVAGVIRTWGQTSSSLIQAWQSGFHKHHPGVTFETSLKGNDSAIGGLYTNSADIAFMDREIWPIEIDAFQQVFEYKPFEIAVMTNSALVVFVNRDNPLSRLTLSQLEGIFGAGHSREARNLATWGELGLKGEWVNKPIHLYGFSIGGANSYFFEQAAMGGSRRWNSGLQEFRDGQQIVDALAADRSGIAISGMRYGNGKVKPIAVASPDGRTYYEPGAEAVALRQYPLTRTASVFVGRAPGQPLEPKVREYVLYILSREGQEAVARDGRYLPLDPDTAIRQSRGVE